MAVTLRLVVTAALLDLAVMWKLHQLRKAPQDRPLLAVTLCVAGAAASFSLAITPVHRPLCALFGSGFSRLLSNALLLGSAFWLMCFYLYSATDRARAGRRVRREAMLLGIVVATIARATVVTPPSVRGRPYATADMAVTSVAVFFTAAGLYLVYALGAALWWTLRYARMSQRPLSTGLWLTALSLACMVAANSLRVAGNVIRWSGGAPPRSLLGCSALLLAVAIPVFVVGVNFSSVATRLAAFRVWTQHRRTYRQMRPLWAALHDAFPEASLHRPATAAWGEALHVRGMHRRYYRRVIECRDGLVCISPHLLKLGLGQAAPPETVAEFLPSALRAHAVGAAADSYAVGIALPSEDSLDADARQLVAISQALRS